MMTKTMSANTTKAETLGRNNYKSSKSVASEKTNKQNSFDKLVDRHIDSSKAEKNYNVSYQNRASKNNSNVDVEERAQTKNVYDDIDPSRLEQLKQSFEKSDKKHINKEPLQERAEDDDTEELTALVASMQKLFTQDKTIVDGPVAIKDAFSDIMDEIKTSALNSKDGITKNTIDKLTELLGNASSLEGETSENSGKLIEMLTNLMNALKSKDAANSIESETQKLETVRALSEQLLKLIDQMLSKDNFSMDKDKANDNRSTNAMLQLIVNRTNLLIKEGAGKQLNLGSTEAMTDKIGEGTEERLNSAPKQVLSDKIKDTIETILSVSNTTSEDELRTIIEQLVANLFSNGDNQKNQSVLNDIMHKYGLNAAESANGLGKIDLDAFKARLTNVLMLMAKDVKSEKPKTLGLNDKANIIDKFARILEDNLEEKGSSSVTIIKSKTMDQTNQNNSAKAGGENANKLDVKEEKLLNSILGKEDNETNSKTEKVNNFISQINNSKDEINTEKLTDKPIIAKSNFSQDIIKTVKYMNLNNLKELTVKIAPKELGEITIKITMTDGNIKANISANTKEAFNLLSNHLGDITTSLGNSEIKIQEANINIYQDDASLMRDSSNNNQNGQSNTNRNSKQSEGKVEGISGINDEVAVDGNNISILV